MRFRSADIVKDWAWSKVPSPLQASDAKVSVVVPISGPEYKIRLNRCLSSIRGSTLKNVEIVVVCVQREERDLSKLDEVFCRYSPRVIRIVRPYDHFPLCFAKNVGLIEAENDIVCFTDADIIFDREVIQRAVTHHTPFVSVLTSYMDRYVDYDHIAQGSLERLRKLVRKGSLCRTGFGGFLLSSKESLYRVRGFDEEYDVGWGGDDCDIVDRLYEVHCMTDLSFLDVSYRDGIFMAHQWHQPAPRGEATEKNRDRYDSDLPLARNIESFGMIPPD